MCVHVFVCVTREVQTQAQLLEVVATQQSRRWSVEPEYLGSNFILPLTGVDNLVHIDLIMAQLSSVR